MGANGHAFATIAPARSPSLTEVACQARADQTDTTLVGQAALGTLHPSVGLIRRAINAVARAEAGASFLQLDPPPRMSAVPRMTETTRQASESSPFKDPITPSVPSL